MALTINTNIKNDADGYLLDAKGVKVSDGKMLDEYLSDLAPVGKTVLDSPLQANTIYDIGALTEDITLTLPSDAVTGEVIYICYTNTGFDVSIVGDLISDVDLLQNSINELMFMRVGNRWSAAYRGNLT